jgi:dolichol kinase
VDGKPGFVLSSTAICFLPSCRCHIFSIFLIIFVQIAALLLLPPSVNLINFSMPSRSSSKFSNRVLNLCMRTRTVG